jgi:putative transposase
MHKIAEKRRRFGYGRVGISLERKGIIMNQKKLYRIYREEGLSVRRRRGRKRACGSLPPMPGPLQQNQRWSLDFLSDTFGASREFRILAAKDDCCRENLPGSPTPASRELGWRGNSMRWTGSTANPTTSSVKTGRSVRL